jgi:hypothetical protein
MNAMSAIPDDALEQLARLAAPLHPADRDPLIHAVIALLKQEPGPGSVNRIVRGLLALGTYRRDVVTGAGRPKLGSHSGYDQRGRRGKHGKRRDDDAA